MNLLWSHVVLIWAIATYLVRDPLEDDVPRVTARWRIGIAVRASVAAVLTWSLSGSLWLALLMLGCAIALPFSRALVPARRCAEVEVFFNAAFAISSIVMITNGKLDLRRVLFHLPLSDRRISAACVVAALGLFTVHGGTYIVRSVLKKSGAVPTIVPAEGSGRTLDVKEYNRGRLIGTLERVLLLAVVIAGSYEALGFIVAAKGLVRSKEFEVSRDMTEYFLIGSLASVLVALTAGLLAGHVIATYWR